MTYFMTYIDGNAVKHTVHEIPEVQLRTTITSLQARGASDIRLWQSIGLIVMNGLPIVGRVLP